MVLYLPSVEPVKVLVSQGFKSFEQFADLAVSWQADFRQLNSGNGSARLFQAQFGPLLLSSAYFDCHVEQQGTTPTGMRTFALFDKHTPQANWFGHMVGPESLLVFPLNGEIDAISRPGFSTCTFCLPETMLQTWFEQNSGQLSERTFDSSEKIIQAPAQLIDQLRVLLRAMTRLSQNDSHTPARHFHRMELEEQLMCLLFKILLEHLPESRPPRYDKHSLLKRLLEFSRSNPSEPLSVASLQKESGVSERSLQYLFKDALGINPKAFISGQRYYAAHRELWRADSSKDSVSRIANNWGFSHLGQFSADYRKLFYELPSTTLKRG